TLPSIVALAVPSVVQQGTYTCWAACVTSIANYYGQNKTESDVWAYAGITNGNSSTAAKTATYAASVLSSSSFGSLDYGKYGNSGNFYDNMYLENVITETYYNSSPIFAVFQGSSAVGHAVVIRGYVTSDTINTIVYMDPDSGSFKASTVTTSSKMTIVVSGETYNFNRGFAVYG
ncbi:MAG: papain-like cysteine protease family protein, partial [Oscillospiraceae bacterium]